MSVILTTYIVSSEAIPIRYTSVNTYKGVTYSNYGFSILPERDVNSRETITLDDISRAIDCDYFFLNFCNTNVFPCHILINLNKFFSENKLCKNEISWNKILYFFNLLKFFWFGNYENRGLEYRIIFYPINVSIQLKFWKIARYRAGYLKNVYQNKNLLLYI